MGTYPRIRVFFLIFTIFSIQSVKGETFFIVTTPNSPCPPPWNNGSASMSGSGVGPGWCLTLEQFVTQFNNRSYDAANITLELESGVHSLDVALSTSDIELFSFVMTSEMATINCFQQDAGLYLDSVSVVNIEGINFVDCGDLVISSADKFRFESSTIQTSLQGSLMLEAISDAIITGSTFLASENNIGAIHINRSSVNVQNCTFSNLTTKAIHSTNSTITIDSSRFDNNSFIHEGSGAVVEAVNFHEIIGSLTITNCDFINNKVGNDALGSIFVDRHVSMMVCGNNFVENFGRVLHIGNTNLIRIDRNSFAYNAGPGAAVYVNSTVVSESLQIFRSNFTSNNDGAVKVVIASPHVTIIDCVFTNNTVSSGEGGAAMAVYEFVDDIDNPSIFFSIENSTFVSNSATNHNGSGGALRISMHSPDSEVYIWTSNFSGNSARHAGAVYIDTCANCTFGLRKTIFVNNTAMEGHGGAVDVGGETTSSIDIQDSVFVNNSAPLGYAGALFLDAKSMDMSGTTFLNNSAQNCGALSLNGLTTITSDMRACRFISNRADIGGGAICILSRLKQLIVYSTNFSYNHAEKYGGVLTTQPLEKGNHDTPEIHLENELLFDHNSAGAKGGVFATFAPIKLDVDLVSFLNNHAGSEGGVMYIEGAHSEVTILFDILMNNNSAADRGGVISINDSQLFFGSTHIHAFNNSADVGAIISACNCKVDIIATDQLFQQHDPNFPNCVLYDVTKSQFATTAIPVGPPDSSVIIAVVIPVVCAMVIAVIIALVVAYVCLKGKCKKDISGGHYNRVKNSDDADAAPLMENA